MSIVLPAPPVRRLTPSDAAAIAKRARALLRAGRITHRQLALVDCLLWSCRSPVTGAISASYTALQRLVHVSRGTIAAALRTLQELGVLTRIKRRVRVVWHQGGTATRQATSGYVLHPPAAHTESAGRTVIQTMETIKETPTALIRDAQAALERRRAIFHDALLSRNSPIEVRVEASSAIRGPAAQ